MTLSSCTCSMRLMCSTHHIRGEGSVKHAGLMIADCVQGAAVTPHVSYQSRPSLLGFCCRGFAAGLTASRDAASGDHPTNPALTPFQQQHGQHQWQWSRQLRQRLAAANARDAAAALDPTAAAAGLTGSTTSGAAPKTGTYKRGSRQRRSNITATGIRRRRAQPAAAAVAASAGSAADAVLANTDWIAGLQGKVECASVGCS